MQFQSDNIPAEAGELNMTFIGHGSLMFTYGDIVMHIDAVSQYADYGALPRADVILLTHSHFDHMDPPAIERLRAAHTELIGPETVVSQLGWGRAMRNGDSHSVAGMSVEAVPAYNVAHMRPDGRPYHPRGEGNGYLLGIGGVRVYVAGDTEDVPEMAQLTDIDVAFLPMNVPYTMTPAMVANACAMCRPAVVYPYHFGDTDTGELSTLLAAARIATEVRVRALA